MALGARSVVLQRRLRISDWIRRNGVTRVEMLAETLGVSAVTIRADLAYLEEQGLVVRSSGKARPIFSGDEPHSESATLRRGAYLPALRSAASLIGHDLSVLLGPGRLPIQLIPELSDRRGLVLLLTSLDAVTMARDCLDARLHLLGGELAADGSTLSGPQSVHALASHRIDLFVMQAAALSPGHAILPPGVSEPLHQAGCRNAATSIALISDERTIAPDAGRPRIPLTALGHLVLAHQPDPPLRTLLAASGFFALEAGPGGDTAVLFSRDCGTHARRSA